MLKTGQILVLFAILFSFGASVPELLNFSGQVYLKSKLKEDIFLAQGIANRNHQVPINQETVFDIASLNKSFIANLILQGVAEGRWERHSKLNDLLGSYGFDARFHSQITLHQMLCHRSGLADYKVLPDSLQEQNFQAFKRLHFSNAAYLSFLAKQKHEVPNLSFQYSNFAYHILAILLEAEYQAPFEVILREKIGEPLRMRHIYSPASREEIIPNLALAYQIRDGKFYENDYIDLSLGRRIFCGAFELMQWLEAKGGCSLLPDSLGRLVMQNQVADLDSTLSYGYGWVPYKAGQHFAMGDLGLEQDYFIHGGSTEGYQSLAISCNGGETNLVLIANNGDGRALFERAQSILKKLYHEE